MTRLCRECNVDKELTEFPKERAAKLGRRSTCSECRRAYHRQNSKLYYRKHRAYKIAKAMAYEQKNIEKVRAQRKARQMLDSNREKERLRSRLRRQDRSGRAYRAYLSRRYQARKYAAVGHTTRQQLQWRWEYYGGKCWLCVDRATETDHVIPLSKGGSNWPANLKPICKPCNVRKSGTWPYKPTVKV